MNGRVKPTDKLPIKRTSGSRLQKQINSLRKLREKVKSANRRPRIKKLSSTERSEILGKTGGRCHICGGKIRGPWNADHVKAHSSGGKHTADNYLPAHGTCNNYRWDYLPEEFELILKLGVWTRTQIEKKSVVGNAILEKFSQHDQRRIARRKK